MQEQFFPDFIIGNWYTSTHPNSSFVNHLKLAIAGDNQRFTLFNNQFSVYPEGEKPNKKRIHTEEEMYLLFSDIFNLEVNDLEGLKDRMKTIIQLNE